MHGHQTRFDSCASPLPPLPESHPLCTMHINGDQALQPHPQQAERARIITKRTLYTTVILACGFMW
jgi:hypothetical protein